MSTSLNMKAIYKPDPDTKAALHWRELYGGKWMSAREIRLCDAYDRELALKTQHRKEHHG